MKTFIILKDTTVHFNNLTTGDTYSYLWEFHDGTISREFEPNFTYPIVGIYEVKLTVVPLNWFEIKFLTFQVEVIDNPDITVTIPDYFISNQSFDIVISPNQFTIGWSIDFDDTIIDTSSNTTISHIYNSPGEVTIIITYSNKLLSLTKSYTRQVHTPLFPKFICEETIYINSLLYIVNLSEGLYNSLSFDINGEQTITESSDIFLYEFSTVGEKILSLTIGNDDFTETYQKIVTVIDNNIRVHIEAVHWEYVNVPISIQGIINGSYDEYYWMIDGEKVNNPLTFNQTFISIGEHVIQLICTTNNNIFNFYKTIMIKQTPSIEFESSSKLEYINTDISFKPYILDSYNSVLWNFGDGNTSTDLEPIYSYNSNGIYNITLDVYRDHVTQQLIKEQFIYIVDSDFNFDFTADITGVCSGNTITFSSEIPLSLDVNYLWDFGDYSISQSKHPLKVYNNSGIYSVSLTISYSTFTKTIIKENYISVFSPVQARFFVNNHQLVNVPFKIYNLTVGGTDNLIWEFIGPYQFTSTDIHPVITLTKPGEWLIRLSNIDDYCPKSIFEKIIIVI